MISAGGLGLTLTVLTLGEQKLDRGGESAASLSLTLNSQLSILKSPPDTVARLFPALLDCMPIGYTINYMVLHISIWSLILLLLTRGAQGMPIRCRGCDLE